MTGCSAGSLAIGGAQESGVSSLSRRSRSSSGQGAGGRRIEGQEAIVISGGIKRCENWIYLN